MTKAYNPRQNIWKKVKKSSNIRQYQTPLIFAFAYFLTTFAKALFLEGRLSTKRHLHRLLMPS